MSSQVPSMHGSGAWGKGWGGLERVGRHAGCKLQLLVGVFCLQDMRAQVVPPLPGALFCNLLHANKLYRSVQHVRPELLTNLEKPPEPRPEDLMPDLSYQNVSSHYIFRTSFSNEVCRRPGSCATL